jgi:8-oxo-dGTP pyrophosphatase MutT (NUDIX family)
MILPADEVQQPERPIVRLAERAVYKNRYITVYDDEVRFSDGRTGTYIRIAAAGDLPGVAVLPIAVGHVGLVHVYRYPVESWEWGLPRGYGHSSNPEESAQDELMEELGERPQQLTFLGQETPDSGALASVIYLFAAQYDHQVSAPRDTVEVAGVHWVPVPELLAGIAAGDITDGFTLSAVCLALCKGVLPTAPLCP